jgi:hypothetical protein
LVTNVLLQFGNWLFRYLDYIAMAVVATLIFVYGADINRLVKRMIRCRHFLLRLTVFVLVCAFGFGTLTALGINLVGRLLEGLDRQWLGPVVVLIFLGIGFLAERKNQM